MNNAIEIKGLDVALCGFKLKNINMEIQKGVVVGLIGKNGAGKTTLIKTLTDVYLPEKGTISYDGRNMYENAVEIKQSLGIVYDDMYYPSGFKAKKVVKMIAPLYPDFDMDRWHKLMKKFGLDEKKRPIEYSKGMQMKFMLAMVLARNPKILILDEPAAGIDPKGRKEILETVKRMHDETGITVIMVSHSMEDVANYADRIFVMDRGRLVMQGTPDEIFAKPKELEKIGLSVPESRRIMELLAEKFDVSQNAYTVEDAVEEIYKLLKNS